MTINCSVIDTALQIYYINNPVFYKKCVNKANKYNSLPFVDKNSYYIESKKTLKNLLKNKNYRLQKDAITFLAGIIDVLNNQNNENEDEDEDEDSKN